MIKVIDPTRIMKVIVDIGILVRPSVESSTVSSLRTLGPILEKFTISKCESAATSRSLMF